MAQKAIKTLAARNTAILRRTHLITLGLHSLFLLLHFFFSRPRSLLPYFVFTLPTLLIEFYLDRLGRPRYNPPPDNHTLRSPGEDLESKGLTEYLWDVLYWTWGCMGAVCLFGDRAWWLWIAVPLYSVYLGVSTVMGLRKGFLPGMVDDAVPVGGESKRQKKLEKRGQRVKYR
ncbi:hypothetical protein VTO42DRAFT_6264 [Malbranchea cinnamomea]